MGDMERTDERHGVRQGTTGEARPWPRVETLRVSKVGPAQMKEEKVFVGPLW